MERVDTDPDAFLASFDDAVIRADMTRLDEVIRSALTRRCRVLWEGTMWGGTDQSIIGYGDLVQSRPRGDDVEWFLVGLARQKRNYSIYLNAVEDGAYLGQRHADRLGTGRGKVKIGAASIGFAHLADLDLDVLAELVRRADELTPADRAP